MAKAHHGSDCTNLDRTQSARFADVHSERHLHLEQEALELAQGACQPLMDTIISDDAANRRTQVRNCRKGDECVRDCAQTGEKRIKNKN